MGEHPRMSKQTLQVLEEMLREDVARDFFGLELAKLTGVQPGTLYPILHRLERAGWLEASPEEIDPREAKRPARRLYRLTGKGELAARARLDVRAASRRLRLISRPESV